MLQFALLVLRRCWFNWLVSSKRQLTDPIDPRLYRNLYPIADHWYICSANGVETWTEVVSFIHHFAELRCHFAEGIIMFFVKRSLSHVRKLYIDDLTSKKMTVKLPCLQNQKVLIVTVLFQCCATLRLFSLLLSQASLCMRRQRQRNVAALQGSVRAGHWLSIGLANCICLEESSNSSKRSP